MWPDALKPERSVVFRWRQAVPLGGFGSRGHKSEAGIGITEVQADVYIGTCTKGTYIHIYIHISIYSSIDVHLCVCIQICVYIYIQI